MSAQSTLASELSSALEHYVSNESIQKIIPEVEELTSHGLATRQIYDLEVLMNKGGSPLKGLLSQSDHYSVVGKIRLANCRSRRRLA